MNRLELDFIAPPRRPLWPGVLVLAGSLAVSGALGMHYHNVRVELEKLETAGDLLSAERRPQRAIPKERIEEAVKNAETVVRQLTLPWASLAETIESAATKDVAILQLQPDAQQRLLRLTAEARHQAAMLEYLRRLAATQILADVHVVSHQVQLEDPQRPIQFAVQASFRGAP
jgi:Tfp pilus assembly protein PilN